MARTVEHRIIRRLVPAMALSMLLAAPAPAGAEDAAKISATFKAYGPVCSYGWRTMRTQCATLVRNDEGWVDTSFEDDGEGVSEAMSAAASEKAARLNAMVEEGKADTVALTTSASFCESDRPHPLCEAHGFGPIPERSATFESKGSACGKTHCGALILNELGQGAALIRDKTIVPADALAAEIARLVEEYNAYARTGEGMRGYSLDVCARGGPVCERFGTN